MDKKKLLNVIMYAAGICLAGFYILILWWGINPNVPIEYNMYYITNELKDWPGYGRLDYEYGTIEICTSDYDKDGNAVKYKTARRKGAGWAKDQTQGSVSNADESFIYYVPVKAASAAELKIDIMEYDESNPVEVYANDVKLGEFSDKGCYRFRINDIEAGELLTICFKSDSGTFMLWKAVINEEGQG